jgi:hypothetical protein
MPDKHHPKENVTLGRFSKLRTATILLAFLAIGGVLLTYEHRVHLFMSNEGLLGVLAVCVIMVLFIVLIARGGGAGTSNNKDK